MKILFINQTFHPDPVATAQQLTDIAVRLQEKGHEITVLTGRRSYANPHISYPSKESFKGVQIYRTWPIGMTRLKRKARVFEALFMNIAFCWKLFMLRRVDRIVVLTSPPMIPFVGALYCRFKKVDLIQWVMDINPDEIIEAGWITLHDYRARLLDSALRYALRSSRKIIVLDRFMKERLIKKSIPENKLRICQPWPHDDDLQTISHHVNPFRTEHQLQDKFIVMYSGNHSLCHPLDTILGAAEKTREDKQLVYVFIGGGERVKEVQHYKEKHRLCNIIQIDYQKRDAIKYSLSAANIHTVVMGDRFVGVVHPSKFYGMLKIGRPFIYIGPKESHIQDIMIKHNMGSQIQQGDVDGFVREIEKIRSLSDTRLEEVMMKAKQIIETEFSSALLMKKMEAELI